MTGNISICRCGMTESCKIKAEIVQICMPSAPLERGSRSGDSKKKTPLNQEKTVHNPGLRDAHRE